MNSNEEVTWVLTSNTVKHRMIESSLIHSFSDAKKLYKSTRLLNKLLEKYHNLNRYQDYVKMKKLIMQKISDDTEVEDDESFGEDDYSIVHKLNLLYKNDIRKRKNTTSKKKNSLTPNVSNDIISTHVDLVEENRKRSRRLSVNDKNEVPAKRKRSRSTPKICLKNNVEIYPLNNKKNSSNSLNSNDLNTSLEEIIDHTTAVLDTEDNTSLTDKIRNEKKVNDCTHKVRFMDDIMNEPSMQPNHLQLPCKYSIEKKEMYDLTNNKKDKVMDHFEISNDKHIQEIASHNTNNIQNIENTSHDIRDVIVTEQDKLTYDSNITHDNININNNVNVKSKSDACPSNSIILQSQKSPPKVKSTEIINKKYKIVNKEDSYNELSSDFYNNIQCLESSTPLNFLQDVEEKLQENGDYEESINSSMLSQSEKRVRQLKMLNLSLESSSSNSEDEILQQKDNLNKTAMLHDSSTKSSKADTTWSKLKLNRSYDKHKTNQSFHNSQNVNNSLNQEHNECNKDLTKYKKISSKKITQEVQRLGERPYNLENFIKKEELVLDKTKSAFSLPNFSKDEDIFLIDMPITVQLADLQGQKLLLRNKLLKLGKKKYEISCKDVPSQSCVFSTCNNSEPYKMINIKPKSSVLVKRKFFSVPVSEYYEHNTKC